MNPGNGVRPHLVLCAAGLLFTVATTPRCGRAPDNPTARRISLLDRIEEAEIRSPLDLDALEGTAIERAATVVDGSWRDLAPGMRVVLPPGTVPWLGDDEPVRLVRAPVEPSRLFAVTVAASSSGADPPRAELLEVPLGPDVPEAADREAFARVLRDLANFREPLRMREHRFLRPDEGTRSLWILLSGTGDEAWRVSVRRCAEVDGVLLDVLEAEPGRPPERRRVHHARRSVDSLVLGAPGRFHVGVRLPRGAAHLRARTAVVAGEGAAEVRLAVETKDGTAKTNVRLRAGSPLWREVDLPLPTSLGEASVTVETVPLGASGVVVAIGEPRIVASSDDDPRPDIVVISLDTVRRDRLSVYGWKRPTTPFLDRLAREAVVFERAYTTAPWTLPAHVSILSGTLPDRHGATGARSRVPADLPWLAERFRAAGWRTVGATGGGYVGPAFGFDRGFSFYGFDDPARPPRGFGDRPGATPRDRAAESRARHARAELLSEIARAERAPLFAFVHTYVVHEYNPGRDDLLALGAAPEEARRLSARADLGRVRRLGGNLPTAEREALRLRYDAALREADRLVADVVEALRRAGRLDRAIVVVLSDHGEELFDHGGFGHGHSVHEELLRVPLLLRAPGVAPSRVRDLVSLADVAPTLLELAGLRDEEGETDGRSLVPLLEGGRLPPRAVLARGTRHERVFRALVTGRYKLVADSASGAEPEVHLFDLDEDPAEERDLAQDRPDLVARLRGRLERLVAALSAARSGSVSAPLAPETEEELRALGYLGER